MCDNIQIKLYGSPSKACKVFHKRPYGRFIEIKGNYIVLSFTTLTSLTPHIFLFGWLKLNLTLLIDQLRLALGHER